MPNLFAASRVKVDRAKRFIHELQIELAYTNRDPTTARLRGDNTTTDISADEMSLVPGAIIGDAVHNLRTALDLMASELARLNKRNDKTVYFPFATSAYDYDAAVASNDFRKCGEDAVDLLKTFKPYRGGNERLCAIYDLDMQDKHTALVPTRRDTIDTQHSPEAAGAAIIGKDITYAFPEGGMMDGHDIIETLKEFVEIVDGVIEAFARMVELRAAAPDRGRLTREPISFRIIGTMRTRRPARRSREWSGASETLFRDTRRQISRKKALSPLALSLHNLRQGRYDLPVSCFRKRVSECCRAFPAAG